MYQQLLATLSAIPQVRFWGDNVNSICVQSFTVPGVSHYDLAVLLDQRNIAVRVGHHCAMPLMNELDIDGTIRVSLAAYNNSDDIHALGTALIQCIAELTEQVTLPATADISVETKLHHSRANCRVN